MLYEIDIKERSIIEPLFKEHKRDRVLINSVLEGHFGSAYADSKTQPAIARLDAGSVTMLGGNPKSPHVKDILKHKPIHYVTPENNDWRQILQEVYNDKIFLIHFVDFSSQSLNKNHLKKLIKNLLPDFEVKKIDSQLAKQVVSDMDNEYFFENFQSTEDFLKRGIGYCILYNGKIVSAATSMAMCKGTIDIEIETTEGSQGKGLGTIVGAKLVLYCLENNIKPKWLAANPESEKLALKLGYKKIGTYDTFGIKN
jgi:hypothetical protein